MSIAVLVIGESGTGKSASLRNLDPTQTLLIQTTRKPLPFPSKGWREIQYQVDPKTGSIRILKGGSIFVSSVAAHILQLMESTSKPIIVIDDWQYILSFMYMARRNERGFDKFTAIGAAGFDIIQRASELAPEKRVYILAHSATDEQGRTRIKTIGKLLDEKICIEGLFTTVLRTHVDPGNGDGYFFSTQNSGSDTVKSPMGMFAETLIANDLAAIDARICEYYGLTPEEPEPAQQPEAPQPPSEPVSQQTDGE